MRGTKYTSYYYIYYILIRLLFTHYSCYSYKIAVRDARRQMWMEVGRVKSDVQKLKVQDLAVRRQNMLNSFKFMEFS